eukprot:GEMP01022330.1.p1 GENE.GEMP01022330.1~~GEMP01022330.1.p1  ORF type:complete len:252 (+),score=38.11 GEMP01022330.1:157-912(+)
MLGAVAHVLGPTSTTRTDRELNDVVKARRRPNDTDQLLPTIVTPLVSMPGYIDPASIEFTGCFNCGLFGHFLRECPLIASASPAKRRRCDDNKCFTCGGYGHQARDCPADKHITTNCKGVCFDFREKHHCRFGDLCKYSHDVHKFASNCGVQDGATTPRPTPLNPIPLNNAISSSTMALPAMVSSRQHHLSNYLIALHAYNQQLQLRLQYPTVARTEVTTPSSEAATLIGPTTTTKTDCTGAAGGYGELGG